MNEQGSAPSEPRTRVAILGGGCGGLAAAWELTSSPALRERFEVTVYERSWALGGKGASGRVSPADGDRGRGRRIHEHGLHIWFGFYEHAFRMLRGAYEEAGLAAGDDWWRLPFQKCDGVSLYEQRDDGTWLRQPIRLPRRGGADRGPPTEPRRLALGRVIARTTRLVATGLRTELGAGGSRRGGTGVDDASVAGAASSTLDRIADELDQVDSPLSLGGDDGHPPARGVVTGGRRLRAPSIDSTVAPLLEQLSGYVGELRARVATTEASDRLALWRGVLELVAASLKGIVADDVLGRGFDVLDEEDLREWLGRHGASDRALARSPVLRGLYDLTFAYREGDKRRPSLAAGKGLQSLLMMINYEGSFMWRMRAGMGDVVFSPLYLSLRERGVRFQFFSHVTRLGLMPGRPVIDSIEVTREATVRDGVDRYEPIERIGPWWCWPAAPYREQLSDFEAHAETLVRGSDFDDVVLAIPVGGLSEISGELARANPRFEQMLDRAETVQTKGMQLWLTRSIDELRQRQERDGLDPPATAYAEPFDTYCDMSHLLEAEGHGGADQPKGVAYFCAVLRDGAEAELSVRAGAREYLERHAATIWPGSIRGGAFDWGVLFDPQGRDGPDRLDAQYFRANVAATDRYVTTPAGSVDARLHPDQSGFENLVLAGDWTHNGIDGGCVEAAVVSGKRAAAALIGRRRRPPAAGRRTPYVEYGALATAPGPLLCERARLYCFMVSADRARLQQLCDRVLKEPTGGARRYLVPRLAPVILSFGTIAGLRSLHPDHADRGSASEPEAAVWIPTIAQREQAGQYVDEHLAIFMPYLWVDDPIAFASGREVYGFAKTQGWMRRLDDPRGDDGRPPDPPESLALDVYGVHEYGRGAELGRTRLITVSRRPARRGGEAGGSDQTAEGEDLGSLVGHFVSQVDPGSASHLPEPARRSVRVRVDAARARAATLAELASEQVVRHVFLKQIRDAERGELAALQQVVEARSNVVGSLRWRRLRGSYDVSINELDSHPLGEELGLALEQTVKLAFVAQFGFRMEPGVVRWPAG
jgi:uncharacterized protein with NAD-binding domain and iron-sulfur cluster